MTTQEDWAFRAQHLVNAAKSIEMKAAEMMKQAAYLREQAAKLNPTSNVVLLPVIKVERW